MLHIGVRDQHTLAPRQLPAPAYVKEALDLLVDAADRLNFTLLVDRAGYGQILSQRQTGKCRHQRVKLGGRGAVPLHAGIGLLEDETAEQRHRGVESITARKESGQD